MDLDHEDGFSPDQDELDGERSNEQVLVPSIIF